MNFSFFFFTSSLKHILFTNIQPIFYPVSLFCLARPVTNVQIEFLRSESIKPNAGDTLLSKNEGFEEVSEEIQEIEEVPETLNHEQENFIKIDVIAPEIGV